MKRISLFLLLGVIFITISSCSFKERLEKRYYIFDYTDIHERPELRLETSLPYSVIINDARISYSYSRKQIVKRHYGPQIRYLDYHLWGVRLEDAIPDLVSTRIKRYNIFAEMNRDILLDIPDYQINLNINNLEIYETEYLSEAHLNMNFVLMKMNEANPNLTEYDIDYSIDRTFRIQKDDIESFVQRVNEMILQETDNFIVKILNEFLDEKLVTKEGSKVVSRYEEVDYSAIAIGDTTMVEDQEIGLIYLPNLSGENNEPYYYVKDFSGNEVGSARMGEELPLPEGTYNVEYGSLRESRLLFQKVEIKPRWRYNVEPDWGCLIINVMDEQRNYAKVGYTIYDNEDGFDYGIDYPADINLGEKPAVWVLKPGTYKVTINSESFNTYRDFTTIEVLENECQRLTLIVEEDDENSGLYSLIGSGIINEADTGEKDSNWRLNSAIHLNVNLNTDNSEKKDDSQLSINMSAQLDNSAYYEKGRLKYTLKNLMEVGTNKDEDFDQFRVDLDDFDLKNTFVFNVISAFGLYGRLDMNTHFFPAKSYEDLNYIKISTTGDTLETEAAATSIETSSSFFPMTLKEGFGLNFQLINNSRSDMNLRVGLGARQDFRNNVFMWSHAWADTVNDLEYQVYREQESSYYEGIEASLVGDLQIFKSLNYSLTADFLFPFDSDQNYTMDFENVFNLKLFKYISLDYRLKFYTQESDVDDDYITTQQSLFLRFTYLLR